MSVQLAKERPQDGLAVEVRQRRRAKGVEGTDIDAIRVTQDGQR